LVAGVQGPEIVEVVRRAAQAEEVAVAVADPRRLDLDHPRAEVAHPRRRRRPGDEAGAVDHEQIAEKSRRHRSILPGARWALPLFYLARWLRTGQEPARRCARERARFGHPREQQITD